MASHIVSLRISQDMKQRMDRLSSATNRSVDAIAEEALADYLTRQEDEAEALDRAIARADQGDAVSHEAAERWLTSWGTADEQAPPVADIVRTRR
jgi:predicted transcriptional regulator